MPRQANVKRVPLSINISEHAKAALLARAEREGHRYPAAFAAHLLEKAIGGGGAAVDVEALSAAVSKLEAAARSLASKGALTAEQGASLARALSGLAADMRQAMKEASDG